MSARSEPGDRLRTVSGRGRPAAPDPIDAAAVPIDLGALRVAVVRPDGMEAHVDAGLLLSEAQAPEPPYWMHLWPGALALARRLVDRGLPPGVRVLELGCGLAVPAVVAARLGAAATASDWKAEPLRFAARSAALNGVRLDLLQMDWSRPALRDGFDLVLGADIAYAAEEEGAIAAALRSLVVPGGTAWLADSVNTYRTTLAPRLAQAGFHVEADEVREWSEGRPVWVRVLAARRGR